MGAVPAGRTAAGATAQQHGITIFPNLLLPLYHIYDCLGGTSQTMTISQVISVQHHQSKSSVSVDHGLISSAARAPARCCLSPLPRCTLPPATARHLRLLPHLAATPRATRCLHSASATPLPAHACLPLPALPAYACLPAPLPCLLPHAMTCHCFSAMPACLPPSLLHAFAPLTSLHTAFL